MVGLVEALVMLCIAGYYNGNVGTADLGDEDSAGGFVRGTRNREGRDLVELVTSNTGWPWQEHSSRSGKATRYHI